MPYCPEAYRITAADELYSHQLVAPRLVTSNVNRTWAERCYHVLYVNSELMLGLGRAIYPYAGKKTAFASVREGTTLHTVRAGEDFILGDNPDAPQVGPIRIEVIDPLDRIRLVLDDPTGPISFDLLYVARSVAVPTMPNVIELGGDVVTNYMNFYQSGLYSGIVRIADHEWKINERAGFRDRGWGIRKHEGAPARGLVLFASLEFPDLTLYLLLYEKADGRRVFTNGWLVDDAGIVETVTGVEHDLILEGRQVSGGRLVVCFASGSTRTVIFEVDNRHHLSAGGYSRSARADGYTARDLTDAAVRADLEGQTDNGGVCWLDDVKGYGFVETGIGIHTRYRPE